MLGAGAARVAALLEPLLAELLLHLRLRRLRCGRRGAQLGERARSLGRDVAERALLLELEPRGEDIELVDGLVLPARAQARCDLLLQSPDRVLARAEIDRIVEGGVVGVISGNTG